MRKEMQLRERGQLIRKLGQLREMLPGSFVESELKCGKANCRCAEGKRLHSHFVLSVLVDGKPRTFHIPAGMVQEVRRQVAMHKEFQQAEARICKINLTMFLEEKEKQKRSKGGPRHS